MDPVEQRPLGMIARSLIAPLLRNLPAGGPGFAMALPPETLVGLVYENATAEPVRSA